MAEQNSIKKSGLGRALAWTTILSVVIILSLYPVTTDNLKWLAGPVLLVLGCLPLLLLKTLGYKLPSVGADIVFGAFDTGFMTVGVLVGVTFAGVLGALVGAGAGDAITDAYAGTLEGKVATKLREKGIDESRKPVATSLGKMSGCLLGAGVTVTIAIFGGLV